MSGTREMCSATAWRRAAQVTPLSTSTLIENLLSHVSCPPSAALPASPPLKDMQAGGFTKIVTLSRQELARQDICNYGQLVCVGGWRCTVLLVVGTFSRRRP